MSLSRSPIWTHRAGAPSKAMDWRRFSSQRMLSLASMGTRVGLTLRLSAAVPLNCCRDQNFTAERPNGRPSVVTAREECMKATDRVHPEAAGFVLTAVHAAGDADRLGALALERELGGVLDHQNGAVRRGEAVARGLEMAGEDLRLADPIIGEEAVSRLRVRPVLACERQARPDRARHTLDEFAQALAQT